MKGFFLLVVIPLASGCVPRGTRVEIGDPKLLLEFKACMSEKGIDYHDDPMRNDAVWVSISLNELELVTGPIANIGMSGGPICDRK